MSLPRILTTAASLSSALVSPLLFGHPSTPATAYVLVEVEAPEFAAGMALAINATGSLAGTLRDSDNSAQAFLWSNGSLKLLDAPDGYQSQAYGLNDAGIVVGAWRRDSSTPPRPIEWVDDLGQDLGTLGGSAGIAYDINNHGDIVGYATSSNGAPNPFLLKPGSDMLAIDLPGPVGLAYAINDEGIMAGFYQTASTSAHGVVFDATGAFRTIPSNGNAFARVRAINANGQIAGHYTDSADNDHAFVSREPFFTPPISSPSYLTEPAASLGSNSVGFGINDFGHAVGGVVLNPRSIVGWRYDGNNLVDLNTITLGLDPLVIAAANAINNRGQIAVTVTDLENERVGAGLLQPLRPFGSILANLSVRAALQPGRPLITGWVVSGEIARRVLIRGIGPGMSSVISPGTVLVTDPRLTLYDATSAAIDANDDWADDPDLAATASKLGAFPLTAHSADAAFLSSLRGPHSVHLTADTAGLALTELYDADEAAGSGAPSRVVNFSARYAVGTGDNVLVAGFVISGTDPKTVLIRGLGPALVDLGVSDALPACRLEVFDHDGKPIGTNDRWAANLTSIFSRIGAYPLPPGSADAALVLLLDPGAYTVHLSGVDDATGEGLIEVYDLDLDNP